MKKPSRSQDRNSFQKESYLRNCKERGQEPSAAYLDMFDNILRHELAQEKDPQWAEDNMEYDLRTTDWILAKVRASDSYAQNLYAAMCNNDFQKLDVMPILTDKTWSCTWRYAGGIVSHMRQTGDYIDWYCSGIGSAEEGFGLGHRSGEGFVAEGQVTDEIREDLEQLGWKVMDNEDDNV